MKEIFLIVAFLGVLGGLAELYSRYKAKLAGLVDTHPLLRNLAGEFQLHRGIIRFVLLVGMGALLWRMDPLAGAVLFGVVAAGSWADVIAIWARIRAKLPDGIPMTHPGRPTRD